MPTTTTEGPALLIGYGWRLQIETDAAMFTEGAQYIGQIRERPNASEILATIDSANGGAIRISDQILELSLRPDQTNALSPGRVVMDLVRIDIDPDLHLGFVLEIPVVLPITRGLGP